MSVVKIADHLWLRPCSQRSQRLLMLRISQHSQRLFLIAIRSAAGRRDGLSAEVAERIAACPLEHSSGRDTHTLEWP